MRQQQSPQQHDSSSNLLWGVVGGCIALSIAWHFSKVYVIQLFLYVKWFEMFLLSPFSSWASSLADEIIQLDPHSLPDNVALYINQLTSSIYVYITLIILICCSIHLYIHSPSIRFARKHSMQTLLEKESNLWSALRPIVHLDLIQEDIHSPDWGMALSPLEFLEQKKLIQKHKNHLSLNRKKTFCVLALQLGKPWKGVDALLDYQKILFAMFLAKIIKKPELSKQIEKAAQEDYHNDQLSQMFLSTDLKEEFLQNIQQKHAYVMTVMGAMLSWARQYGVFPSSAFLWLKPLDRRLWFMLSSIGRRVAFVEVAGCFSHWMVESCENKAIQAPQVMEAVDALNLILRENDVERVAENARFRTRT